MYSHSSLSLSHYSNHYSQFHNYVNDVRGWWLKLNLFLTHSSIILNFDRETIQIVLQICVCAIIRTFVLFLSPDHIYNDLSFSAMNILFLNK